MFEMFKKDRKDPADIARDYAKEHEITVEDVKDENPSPEGSDSSTDDKKADDDEIEDDKSSRKEGETQKAQGEDKEETLSEEDQKLVDTPDEELDDEAKTKKAEIGSRRKKTAEDRITQLISSMKEMEHRMSVRDTEYQQKLVELEAEKKQLEEKIGEPSPSNIEQDLENKAKERVNKYLEEDRGLPRESRREMSKDDLEEWLVEDYAGATEWLIDRRARRQEEVQQDKTQVVNMGKAKEVLAKQDLSKIRVEARHPELKVASIKARKEELAREGKTESQIQEILKGENDKYRVMGDVMRDKEFMQTVIYEPNAPELLEKEMLKRLDGDKSKKGSGEQDLLDRIAELEDLVKAKSLRGNPVGVGAGSRAGGGKPMDRDNDRHNPELEKTLSLMRKKGYKMTVEEFNKAKEDRRSIPGAEVYDDGTDR